MMGRLSGGVDSQLCFFFHAGHEEKTKEKKNKSSGKGKKKKMGVFLKKKSS